MTHQPHPGADAGDRSAAKPNDNSATGQKLLDDLQGRFYQNQNSDSVKKLVDDGILPPGSSVIDFGEVRNHLAQDKAALEKLNGTQPTDTKAAEGAVKDAQGAADTAKNNLDAAQAKVDPVQKQIDDRNNQDKQMKEDFATVSGALDGRSRVYKDDLTTLAGDASKPQAVRDAAQRMLNTYHEEHIRAGRASQTVQRSDYGDNTMMMGTPYFDKASIDAGVAKHAQANAADQKTLDPLLAARDQAKTAKDAADTDLAGKQKTLDDQNKANKDLDDNKKAVSGRIADEQAALTPGGEIDKLGRVTRGGGYYQVAENLLGIKGHHTAAQERELRMLTRILQDEARQEHNGQLPRVLKQNDQLLKPENLEHVMSKLRQNITPAQPTR